MKLLRLVTTNNGVFKSSFQNDMTLAPYSKLALLNLTFQTKFENINIDPNNSAVDFQSDITDADTDGDSTIKNDIYTEADIEDYYTAVELALNSSLSLESSFTEATGVEDIDQNRVFSMFKINDIDGIKRIEYRYAPLLNPFMGGVVGDIHERMFYNNTDTPAANLLSPSPDGVTQIVANGITHVADRSRNTFSFPDRPMSQGNAIYTARCKDIRDNGSGLQDNGFAIGLSHIPIPTSELTQSELSSLYQSMEIRVNRMGENYQYINGGTETDSGIPPKKIDLSLAADLNDHDIMGFEMSDGNINFVIYKEDATNAGERNVFLTTPVVAGRKYYPYMYINGGSANCVVDMLNITIDPFIEGNEDLAITGNNDESGQDNSYDDLLNGVPTDGAVRDAIPQVGQSKWNDGADDFTASLTLNSEVWKSLGFIKNSKKPGNITQQSRFNVVGQGIAVWTPERKPIIKNSDNFVIQSDSLMLDSYDASAVEYEGNIGANFSNERENKGRRKNILMTIPTNDNNSGLVEYEASTPIFIDLNNEQPINQKNLNFRILRSDFSPIITNEDESAIMTVVIDSDKVK